MELKINFLVWIIFGIIIIAGIFFLLNQQLETELYEIKNK